MTRVDTHFSLQDPRFESPVMPKMTLTTLNTAGNISLTVAHALCGLLDRDPNGNNRTDTLPTAVALCEAIQGPFVGLSFDLTIRNTADAGETITIAAGTGGTTKGTMTIAQNNMKTFRVVFTGTDPGSEAYNVYSLGTVTY
jgi:type II secretory pathway pseudopilin PulG